LAYKVTFPILFISWTTIAHSEVLPTEVLLGTGQECVREQADILSKGLIEGQTKL